MRSEALADSANRCTFIGGSDARIIMGGDDAALMRLWRREAGRLSYWQMRWSG